MYFSVSLIVLTTFWINYIYSSRTTNEPDTDRGKNCFAEIVCLLGIKF